jgi:hypothetical protein
VSTNPHKLGNPAADAFAYSGEQHRPTASHGGVPKGVLAASARQQSANPSSKGREPSIAEQRPYARGCSARSANAQSTTKGCNDGSYDWKHCILTLALLRVT